MQSLLTFSIINNLKVVKVKQNLSKYSNVEFLNKGRDDFWLSNIIFWPMLKCHRTDLIVKKKRLKKTTFENTKCHKPSLCSLGAGLILYVINTLCAVEIRKNMLN